ncbi:MAG: DUF364 domain-containing protein [Candidatus Aerophobetes bacterium]|nr:DUF364 domain-containing protein [Candidatus Aerophobetes bacterium]
MIVDEILSFVERRAKGRVIADVRIGLKYTTVMLDDGSCGLAATLSHRLPYPFPYPGEFIGRDVLEILKMAESVEILPSIVGAATINALLKPDERNIIYGNALDYLKISKEDIVGIVGAFMPLMPTIRGKAKKLYVFDRYPIANLKEYCPDWAEPLILPQCSIAIISGTSVFNRTLNLLLSYLNSARKIALIGPTTPLAPEILKKYKIDLLSGVKVVDAKKILRIVSQGGGTRDFMNSARQVNFILEKSNEYF